jgi:hypothetical protein
MSTITTEEPRLMTTMGEILDNAGAFTENGAPTLATSGSRLVDMFDAMGGLRGDSTAIIGFFKDAWDEDPLSALKLMFLLRNPRGGMGERLLFDVLVKYLSESPDPMKRGAISQNLPLFAKYGRWDDLMVVYEYGTDNTQGTTLRSQVVKLIQNQLETDVRTLRSGGEDVSLLAKWLPSDNASSKNTRAMARKLASSLGVNIKTYRKTLVSLRKALADAVVETKMSSRQFDKIEYSRVCSKASLNYRKAFEKRDTERYSQWVEDVAAGNSKVNAATLFPHEVAWKAMSVNIEDSDQIQMLQNIWNALPEFCDGVNALPVLDVSPSMTFETISPNTRITPLVACLGLGLYLSQRCSGKFKNHFMTFSSEPTVQKIQGNNIVETMKWLEDHPGAGYSTNLQGVFDCMLEAADEPADLPEYIYILTDGEFDDPNNQAQFDTSTNHEVIKAKFDEAGMPMPKLVYWNLQRRLGLERKNNISMKENDYGLVASGFSPAMLEPIMRCEIITPLEIVKQALLPYSDVKLDTQKLYFQS